MIQKLPWHNNESECQIPHFVTSKINELIDAQNDTEKYLNARFEENEVGVTCTCSKWTPREGEQVYRITSRGTIVLNHYNDKAKAREAFMEVFPNNLEGREQAEVRLAEIKALNK